MPTKLPEVRRTRRVSEASTRSRRRGRKASKEKEKEDPFAEAVARFEVEKQHLVKQVSRDRETLRKVNGAIESGRKELEERERKLANTSAMFLHGEEKERASVEMHTKTGSIVRKEMVVKPLGRREAVAQVRRMIRKTLDQLRKEAAVAEIKLNKALDRNHRLRAQVNTLRREKVVYNNVFERMTDELERVKGDVVKTEETIAEMYAARDVCRRETQEVLEHIQSDRTEAGVEWDRLEAEMIAADKRVEGVDKDGEGGAGELTAEEEADLNRRIESASMETERNERILAAAKRKIAAFEDALETLRTETGFEDLDELMEQFEKLEEEKLEKVGAATRTMEEIEGVEADIVRIKEEVGKREEDEKESSDKKEEEIGSLRAEAEHLENQIKMAAEETDDLRSNLKYLLPKIESAFETLGCAELVLEDSATPAAEEPVSASAATAAADAATRKPPLPPPTLPAADADEGGTTAPAVEASGVPPSPVLESLRRGSVTSTRSARSGRSASPAASVSSRRSAARRNSMLDPTAHHTMLAGITMGNVVHYVSVLDQTAANLVQKFAYLVSEARISMRTLDESLLGARSAISSTGEMRTESLHTIEHPDSPVRLGPTEPVGSLAKHLTSSALLAAIVDPAAFADGEDDDDLSRPLSLSEIKAQAIRNVESATVASAKTASEEAAEALISRHKGRLLRKHAGLKKA